jgi:hypothetical protein
LNASLDAETGSVAPQSPRTSTEQLIACTIPEITLVIVAPSVDLHNRHRSTRTMAPVSRYF